MLFLLLTSIVMPSGPTNALTLPIHSPIRILIVSDEVNPHGLPPQDLTQPGEIAPALVAAGVLNIAATSESVHEVPTNQIDQATARLLRSRSDLTAYDVLVYFAHRIPDGPQGVVLQESFVAATREFLRQGGGVVVFHHGIYRLPGKESMQALIGGEATGSVPWNTVDGQTVINVAPGHFITTNGVSYPSSTVYADPSLGIGTAQWPSFANVPDERYPELVLLPGSGQHVPLFASNYALGDGTHVLGYVHRKPGFAGSVVLYQPGEYQPHALTPGNNLQILLNAVLFSRDHVFAGAFE